MNNNHVNVIQKRRLEWYNSLSIDQQRKIDDLYDDKTDTSNYMLRSIKRKRNPIINEGDIFAVQLPENYYLFGRVIKSGIENEDKQKRLNVIFIFNGTSDSIDSVPEVFDYNSSIVGPKIADAGFWSRGYFYNITNIPLSENERNLDYGFYHDKFFRGYYCDEYDNTIEYEPKFLSIYGYVTLYGISMAIREKIILGDEGLYNSQNDQNVKEENITKDYITVIKDDDSIQICFYINHEKIMAIGKKMNEIDENAYMNGYNWEVFFKYYLSKKEPNILKEMDTDPEADMYMAYYTQTPENELKAEKFVNIICSLIEHEEELYNFVREQRGMIEWD